MLGAGLLAMVPVLVVGALLGRWRLQRSLSSAWSRPAPAVGGEDAPYRRNPQPVAVPGAGRLVVVLVGYLYAMGFVGAARVGLAWEAIVNLIDHGHVRANLVPSDARSVVVQAAVAGAGVLTGILFPRAARAIARRDEAMGRAVRLAGSVAGCGAILATLDAVILYRMTERPVTYWIMAMILDDLAYASAWLGGIAVLVVLRRVERAAPPRVEGVGAEPSSTRRDRIVAALLGLLGVAVVGHAIAYGLARFQEQREIAGEIPPPIAPGRVRLEDGGRVSFWFPDDGWKSTSTQDTPDGPVPTTIHHYESARTRLTVRWYDRAKTDTRKIDDLCREGGGRLEGTLIRGFDDEAECETTEVVAGGVPGNLTTDRRVFLDGRRVYVLLAQPGPEGRLFLESFKIHRARPRP